MRLVVRTFTETHELGHGWAVQTGTLYRRCVAWGLATGFVVAYLGFSPVVVTLGGLAGARGVAEILSQGFTKYGFGSGFA